MGLIEAALHGRVGGDGAGLVDRDEISSDDRHDGATIDAPARPGAA